MNKLKDIYKTYQMGRLVRFDAYNKECYTLGQIFVNDLFNKQGKERSRVEMNKTPSRTEIINFLLSLFSGETTYLEIGVRNPDHNYNKIKATHKYSVDPGVEFEQNPVDFPVTSDTFFEQLDNNQILSKNIRFNVIFVDGLHLAEQVDKDIQNSLRYLTEDGFVVLHDCNPPTEWHAREEYGYYLTPAIAYWNGTTWKAFVKWRQNPTVNSCCVDTDWGVGILSKTHPIGNSCEINNPFYEYKLFEENRVNHVNLISFWKLQEILKK
jgi:hypothetical protein